MLNNLTGVFQDTQTNNLGTQSRAYGFDGLNRMTYETNPEFAGNTIHYYYDTDTTCGTSNGDLVKRTDPVGNVTCYAYDSLHRLTSVTYPSGSYSASTPREEVRIRCSHRKRGGDGQREGRLAETYTGPSSPKTTDIGLSYSSRGEVTDTYEATPHTGASYYHTYSTYWANGLVNTLATNMTGVPTFTYSPDPEGRVLSIAASSGQSPVSTTAYNTASQVTGVTYGSRDADTFGFDPNTARPTSYAFAVNGASETGTIANNTNGTIGKLTILDPFNSVTGQTCSPFGERYALNTDSGYFAGMLMQYPFMTDGYQADYRMYHEAQSRWVSPDPAGMSAVDPTNPQSWNRYAYAGNNPLSNIDPSGLVGGCEPPLYWLPNKNGDGGSCVSGNRRRRPSSPGTCAQALAQSGGAPVAGCPGSPPSGPQTGTGTGAGAVGICLAKGVVGGAAGSLVVGGAAAGAVALGIVSAPVVTAVLGVAAVAGGPMQFTPAFNRRELEIGPAWPFRVGSFAGGALVGGAGGRALAETINGVASPLWNIGSDWAQGYRPNFPGGSVGKW